MNIHSENKGNVALTLLLTSLIPVMAVDKKNSDTVDIRAIEKGKETSQLHPVSNTISFSSVNADRKIVPLAAPSGLANKGLLAKPSIDMNSLPKGNRASYENARTSIENILHFALTYQMPNLAEKELAQGTYAGYVIPLPALLKKKNARISFEEMKFNNLVENPVLVGINDSMGRTWTYQQVINQKNKACTGQKLSATVSKYVLDECDYPFLVITKKGSLSNAEQQEIRQIVKTEIAKALDETLSAAEENIKKTNAYQIQDISSELDLLCKQAGAVRQLIKNRSILFKTGNDLPKTIASELHMTQNT